MIRGRALFVGMNFVTSPLLFRKSAIYLEQFLMAVQPSAKAWAPQGLYPRVQLRAPPPPKTKLRNRGALFLCMNEAAVEMRQMRPLGRAYGIELDSKGSKQIRAQLFLLFLAKLSPSGESGAHAPKGVNQGVRIFFWTILVVLTLSLSFLCILLDSCRPR